MEKTIINKGDVTSKIESAIGDKVQRTFRKQVSIETKHGQQVTTSDLKGRLISYDKHTGILEIMESGSGHIVRISIMEINDIL